MKNITTAFSNLSRVKLLACLSEGPKNVTELIGNCGLSQSAVSQHLAKLRDQGIVKTTREGREIIYKLKIKKAGKISKEIVILVNSLSS